MAIVTDGNINVKIDQFIAKTVKNRKIGLRAVPWLEELHRSEASIDRWRRCGYYMVLSCDAEMDKVRVDYTQYCGLRMCPGCEWRQSMRNAACVGAISSALRDDDRVMLMVTLTVPNVQAAGLRDAIQGINRAYNALMHLQRYQVWRDNIRKLEVTYNRTTGTYHPHLHVVVYVNQHYFGGQGGYISHDRLLDDWRHVTRMPEITQVDVRRCRDIEGRGKAVLEVSKYAAKASDYIGNGAQVFGVFAHALRGVRLMGYGGVCRDLRRAWDNGELGAVADDDTQYVWQLLYEWQQELQGYMLVDVSPITADTSGGTTGARPPLAGTGARRGGAADNGEEG